MGWDVFVWKTPSRALPRPNAKTEPNRPGKFFLDYGLYAHQLGWLRKGSMRRHVFQWIVWVSRLATSWNCRRWSSRSGVRDCSRFPTLGPGRSLNWTDVVGVRTWHDTPMTAHADRPGRLLDMWDLIGEAPRLLNCGPRLFKRKYARWIHLYPNL